MYMCIATSQLSADKWVFVMYHLEPLYNSCTKTQKKCTVGRGNPQLCHMCGVGSSGRAHKRDCLRKRHLPQPRPPGESRPDTAQSPLLSNPGPPSVSPEPQC